MNLAKKTVCLMLVCAAPLVTFARQSNADKKPTSDQQTAAVSENLPAVDPSEQHILSALDQLVEAQQGFADDALRVVIRVRIADMLWRFDEPRARLLFKEAFEALARAQPSISQFQHRPVAGIVAQTIVSRDPALAVTLAETLPPYDASNQPRESLRYQLANILALKDPERALQVAKPIAESGDLATLIPLIRQIKMRERMLNKGKMEAKGADDLFIRAFERVKLRGPSLEEIRQLASYLLPSFEQGTIILSAATSNGDRYGSIPIDPKVVEQFFDVASKTVSGRLNPSTESSGGARSTLDYTIIKLLLPYFDRVFLPERAASIRAVAEEAIRRGSPEEQPNLPMGEWGTVQELLAKAEATSAQDQKDLLYQRASILAILNRNLDQASVIIEKISNEKIRENERYTWNLRSNQFYPEDAARAVDRNDFDKAETLIAGIQDSKVRLRTFGYLIEGLSQRDRPRALKMLDDALRLAARLEDRVERSRRLMVLAGVAARIDVSRGFEEMKQAIEEFNRAGFASQWEKGQEVGNSNEAGKGKPGSVNVGLSPLLDDEDFYRLGGLDFDRAWAVAQRFQMREASALAQLAACRGAFSKLQQAAQPEKLQGAARPKQQAPR